MQTKSTRQRLPIGAEVLPGGGVHFRVWATKPKRVSVVIEGVAGARLESSRETALDPEGDGYFSGIVQGAGDGTLYRFRLDSEEVLYPDPASRYQPDGLDGPSQVIDPSHFQWTDQEWPGVRLEGQVIYEMHIGTFTQEGTYEAASRHLPELAENGITLLQIMPLAEFHGRFGWGYDGVQLFAPTRLYGIPDELRLFVDRAHSVGIGVIIDVVYNHLGPGGHYLNAFSPEYFTDRYESEWGDTFNYDGRHAQPVREFITANAGYWIDEYHLDGLRLDATQSIFDTSPEHVIAAITKCVRTSARGRSTVIIAENEPQEVRQVRPYDEGGYGIDGLLNDDFHHTAMVALTGRNDGYYNDYFGSPQEFISCLKWGYLYQGQYYSWQRKRRGTASFDLEAKRFVNFLQNHDQIANTARGERCHAKTGPALLRTMTALLLLTPGTPFLFQGQEFAASSPFLYFADHGGELAVQVCEGRKTFLSQFRSLRSPDIQEQMADPSDPKTFERSKLDHSDRERNVHIVALHRDLIRLRRQDDVFRRQRTDWMHGAVLGPRAFVLRFFGQDAGDRLLLVNFGLDLRLESIPEPLLSPPEASHWEILWSSESAIYGGNGTPPIETDTGWYVPGHATIVLAPKMVLRLRYA